MGEDWEEEKIIFPNGDSHYRLKHIPTGLETDGLDRLQTYENILHVMGRLVTRYKDELTKSYSP